jgi:hypothetical protein
MKKLFLLIFLLAGIVQGQQDYQFGYPLSIFHNGFRGRYILPSNYGLSQLGIRKEPFDSLFVNYTYSPIMLANTLTSGIVIFGTNNYVSKDSTILASLSITGYGLRTRQLLPGLYGMGLIGSNSEPFETGYVNILNVIDSMNAPLVNVSQTGLRGKFILPSNFGLSTVGGLSEPFSMGYFKGIISEDSLKAGSFSVYQNGMRNKYILPYWGTSYIGAYLEPFEALYVNGIYANDTLVAGLITANQPGIRSRAILPSKYGDSRIGSVDEKFKSVYAGSITSDSISTGFMKQEDNWYNYYKDRTQAKDIHQFPDLDVYAENFNKVNENRGMVGGFIASKKGAILSRIDDVESSGDLKKLEYAHVLEKYGYRYTWAFSPYMADNANYDSSKAIALYLQKKGHEILDHTPSHSTEFILCKKQSDVDYFTSREGSGIDSVYTYGGSTYAFLTRVIPDTSDSRVIKTSMLQTVAGTNRLAWISGDPLPSSTAFYYYFVNGKWYNQSGGGSGYVTVTDREIIPVAWPETKTIKGYWVINTNVNLTQDATYEMLKKSQLAARELGLEPLRFFIQPGGSHPMVNSATMEAAGRLLGYYGGECGVDSDRVRPNTYNTTFDLPQWRTLWGDYEIYDKSFASVKSTIADGVARHYVIHDAIHTHQVDNWDNFIARTDSLCRWMHDNKIPVVTYLQMFNTVQNSATDRMQNIIPPLDTDIDGDGKPDGYTTAGTLEKGGVYEWNYYSMYRTGSGELFKIDKLGGVEKGRNIFRVDLKGAIGDTVTFSFTPRKVMYPSIETITVNFVLTSADWQEYETELNIRDIAYTLDILCSVKASGKVSVSYMELRKK